MHRCQSTNWLRYAALIYAQQTQKLKISPQSSENINISTVGGEPSFFKHLGWTTANIETLSGEQITLSVLLVPMIAAPLQNTFYTYLLTMKHLNGHTNWQRYAFTPSGESLSLHRCTHYTQGTLLVYMCSCYPSKILAYPFLHFSWSKMSRSHGTHRRFSLSGGWEQPICISLACVNSHNTWYHPQKIPPCLELLFFELCYNSLEAFHLSASQSA